MPGLSLTCEKAARLLNVDYLLAAAALDELQCEAFLVRASSGRFVRRASTLRRDASNAVPRLVIKNGERPRVHLPPSPPLARHR
jgi:hypothetical protein